MSSKDKGLNRKWLGLRNKLKEAFGKKPKDLNEVLYLIGVQELGKGNEEFSKEQKQDLIHIAICKVLSPSGYYEPEGHDDDGWPHWKNIKPLPHSDLLEQEVLLKNHIIEYFENEIGWNNL
ncbi:MAG: hypothetical protein ABFS32_04020 [Bacteroidota bacterium]